MDVAKLGTQEPVPSRMQSVRPGNVPAGELGCAVSAAQAEAGMTYEWRPSQDSTFFPGRQAAVLSQGRIIGTFGIVHPNVLEKFEIPYPVSALELNLEPFIFDQMYIPLQTHIEM